MITETATFTCSICGEPSTEICLSCTKDSCRNHRCERCKRCSDCCECEVPLSAEEPEAAAAPEEHPVETVAAAVEEPVAEAGPPAMEELPHLDPPLASETEPGA